jgi:PPOX class probable F420-dependent enzyme
MLSEEARLFMAGHRVARLATTASDGAPHLIPLCYALVGDAIYFVIDEKPKRTHHGLARLRNIRANPRVAFLVDDYSDDWSRLAYLLVHGLAAVVDEPVEFSRALQELRDRYPQYALMSLGFGHNPMVRITPERVHIWRAGL